MTLERPLLGPRALGLGDLDLHRDSPSGDQFMHTTCSQGLQAGVLKSVRTVGVSHPVAAEQSRVAAAVVAVAEVPVDRGVAARE